MNGKIEPGLGELLRYVSELVEQGAEAHYQQMGIRYRARYTPVLRALQEGAQTVTEITACSHLTQGAISQTVAHMEAEGLICRQRGDDRRKSSIQLSAHGQQLLLKLNQHWAVTFEAIEQLESEIGFALRDGLVGAARALQQQSFAARLSTIKLAQQNEETVHG